MDAPGLFASHRRKDGVDWYWIVNDSDQVKDVRLRFPDGGRYEKWDAETGARTSLGEQVHFDPWDAFFVVRNDQAIAPKPKSERVLAILPAEGWTLTPEAAISIPYQDGVWLAPERLAHRNWNVLGPFPFDDHEGFYKDHPIETGAWKLLESPTYSVTLPRERGIYYARAEVDSPAARRAQIAAAFADSLKVWWNGQLVLDEHRHPKWSLMRDVSAERRPVEVRQGRNTVLLKIESSLMVPTAFLFRVTDSSGATLRDLKWTPPDKPDDMPEQPIRVAAAPMAFTLHSWTDDARLKWYSGTAIYETKFDLSSVAPRMALDLGTVGTAAEVWVNGKKAGERVWRPFLFDISGLAKQGANTLKIRVANSDANWQCQGDTIYPLRSWGLRYKTELDRLPNLRPNGIEGPVRIMALE